MFFYVLGLGINVGRELISFLTFKLAESMFLVLVGLFGCVVQQRLQHNTAKSNWRLN